jgi:KaiC/GvpD/RAD55 family RecA-like ATPase
MELEKQRIVISALCSNRDLMALCSSILKPSYFDPSLKKSVKFILDYFEKYRDVPKNHTVRAETGAVLDDLGVISSPEMKYVADEIETFCRNKAMTEAILLGPQLINKGDFGKILEVLKDAVSVGLQKDLGVDYFINPEDRLRKTLIDEPKISTGIKELDDAIGGGIGRQELLLFAANSGGGKSMTMLNVGKNLLDQGYNGAYISLEMSEGLVSKRLDSMITRISQDMLLKEMSKAAGLIENKSKKMGKFRIKRMPENRTNINTVRSYLQQLEQSTGFKPDFIIIDYIDIMGTSMQISNDNIFIKDKYVTEEVRSLGFDFNAMMISASQLGRNAIEAEKLNQSHIQGGMSKINTSDYVIAVKQDDLMRSTGEIVFEVLKSRNSRGVGKRILLEWDPISLTINSTATQNQTLELKRKSNIVLKSDSALFKPQQEDDSDNNPILSLMNT